MSVLRTLLVVLSSLLLAAHFLRDGQLLLVLVSLALIALLFVRRPWSRRLTQAVLLLGALEWARTTVTLLQERQALGAPWGRMVLILGTVALVTLASALVLEARQVKEGYAG
jgi:hypothetical protein